MSDRAVRPKAVGSASPLLVVGGGIRLGARLDDRIAIERTRPLREGGGSFSYRYTIGHAGAAYVAARRGDEPPRRDKLANQSRRLLFSPTLEHTLGVNQFFIDLMGHARKHPGTELVRWWSEQRTGVPGAFGATVLSPVRPDGHGIWRDGDRAVGFFLEYDTGTERLGRLVDKLDRYTELVRRGGPAYPVLFWLHSAVREHHLHEKLAGCRPPVLVATSARDYPPTGGDGTAGRRWSLPAEPGPPVALVDLPE